MLIPLLKAKIHRVNVTELELDYEGSCGIDSDLIREAGMNPFERIDIYNVTNGQRFTTYVLEAPAGSGTISLNGASARCAAIGDLVIICSYGFYTKEEAASHEPTLVLADSSNGIKASGKPNEATAALAEIN